MNLACTREGLICAEWHVSCIHHRSGIGEHAYILNSVRIIFKYHMSSVVFGTFLWLPMSSKWKLPVSFINLALKGQGVEAILSFRNLQWSGRAWWEWGVRGHLRIMLLSWIDRNSAEVTRGSCTTSRKHLPLLPHHILCKCLILKVLYDLQNHIPKLDWLVISSMTFLHYDKIIEWWPSVLPL